MMQNTIVPFNPTTGLQAEMEATRQNLEQFKRLIEQGYQPTYKEAIAFIQNFIALENLDNLDVEG